MAAGHDINHLRQIENIFKNKAAAKKTAAAA
jgi:hypothetical protein